MVEVAHHLWCVTAHRLPSDAEEDTSTQVIASRGMAPVAQLVEHLTCNQKVVGSNPTRSEVFGLRSSTLSPVVITPEIISKGKLLEYVLLHPLKIGHLLDEVVARSYMARVSKL